MAHKILLPTICFLWFLCPLAAQTDMLATVCTLLTQVIPSKCLLDRAQYRWGKAVLDIALPGGIEFERIKRPFPSSSENHYSYYGYFDSDRPRLPVFLPSISLGYTF